MRPRSRKSISARSSSEPRSFFTAMNPLLNPRLLGVALSMKRRICRQVLDCGDGVRAVTALAVAAFKIPKLAADTASPTQSGDSENSVAAVQDAGAPFDSFGANGGTHGVTRPINA